MTEPLRVIIAGGREFSDYQQIKAFADKVLSDFETEVVILSGDARGTDRLGEIYAKEKNYQIQHFPADWERFGKAAGPIRNRQMAENADVLIAFWDMQSRGTASMIEEARKHGLMIFVKRIGKDVPDDKTV